MSTPTRARRAPTQERSRRTVRQILEAAEQLVSEGGIDAATTRAIADRAGVAVPSLYRFFADRDEILDALLEQMVAELDEHTRVGETAWEGDDVATLVRLELDLHVAYYAAHPSVVALWFGGRASAAVVESVRRRKYALAARMRELLIARGLVRDDVPQAAFDMLTELGDRVLEVAFRDPGHTDDGALELGVIAMAGLIEHWAPR